MVNTLGFQPRDERFKSFMVQLMVVRSLTVERLSVEQEDMGANPIVHPILEGSVMVTFLALNQAILSSSLSLPDFAPCVLYHF